MPIKGFQYREMESFPDWPLGESYETKHQKALPAKVIDESPRSIITAVGLADHPDFKKFHVMHETFQSVRGRYRNEPITGYVAQEEFHIYYHPDTGRTFIDAPHVLCDELVHRLEDSEIDFLATTREIDLRQLASDLRSEVRGGWFANLKVADVSTIALFGPTVGQSAEWGAYEDIGALSVVDLEAELGGRQLKVKVMSNSGVVVYKSLSEAKALEVLLALQGFLDDYVAS